MPHVYLLEQPEEYLNQSLTRVAMSAMFRVLSVCLFNTDGNFGRS